MPRALPACPRRPTPLSSPSLASAYPSSLPNAKGKRGLCTTSCKEWARGIRGLSRPRSSTRPRWPRAAEGRSVWRTMSRAHCVMQKRPERARPRNKRRTTEEGSVQDTRRAADETKKCTMACMAALALAFVRSSSPGPSPSPQPYPAPLSCALILRPSPAPSPPTSSAPCPLTNLGICQHGSGGRKRLKDGADHRGQDERAQLERRQLRPFALDKLPRQHLVPRNMRRPRETTPPPQLRS